MTPQQPLSDPQPSDAALRSRLLEIASRATHSGGWIVDLRENLLIWSDEMFALHGMAVGTPPTPADVFSLNPPEYHPLMRRLLADCIKHGTSFDQELEIFTASGTRRWVRCIGASVRDAAGRTLAIEGALQDISEKKAYEQAIRASEQRFINVAHATTDAVWDWDLDADVIWWNEGIHKVFGFASEDAAHTSAVWRQRLHPSDHDRVQQKIVDAIKSRSDTWSDEYQSLRSDGTYALVSDNALLIRDDRGRVTRMVGGITDLSARKKLERDLERLNRALRMLTACNELLIRATCEHDLLTAVCDLIVTMGGYRMSFIGFAMQDKARSIVPVAHAGDHGYLKDLRLSWSEHAPHGQGPAGRAIRSGAACFVSDIAGDPGFALWRESALTQGFRAVINLPLRDQERQLGVLAMFADKVLRFGDEEIHLLQQMANDVAFGIGNLRAQAAQRLANSRIREQASLLDKAQDAILVCGAKQHVRFWNKGAERLYGYTSAEAVGQPVHELIYTGTAAFVEATTAAMRDGEWNGELVQRRRDGSLLTAECRWTKVIDEQTKLPSILAIHTDISQRKAAAREIEQLAFYDQLTNLPNRQLLVERLGQSQAHGARSGMIGALLFIDLDNFKTLNDTLGHAKGDQLLGIVSTRLLKCVRDNDTVARFGGDEFVISLVDLDRDADAACAKAVRIGEKILDALRVPIQLSQHEHQGSCSIGIAMVMPRQDSVDNLLKQADLAMYRAKASGRNMLKVFAPNMQTEVNARAESEADLRRAVLQQELRVHYQPQLDQHGRVIGAEALVRWQHPVRGMVSPLEFIFLAEETGLIHPIGKWVLQRACTEFAAWCRRFSPGTPGGATERRAAGEPAAAMRAPELRLMVAVNVSVQQFRHPDFVDMVLGVVEASGIDPRSLKLELTESLLVDDVEATIAKMMALKARGIAFALDDFGTGYSSLAYLKRLPLDELKIDRSFVRDVLTDPNDAAIARTIVALAHSLGLSVIAEGVETALQKDFLEQHGCNAYQGYFFSRPLAPEAFEQFLLQHAGVRIAA